MTVGSVTTQIRLKIEAAVDDGAIMLRRADEYCRFATKLENMWVIRVKVNGRMHHKSVPYHAKSLSDKA